MGDNYDEFCNTKLGLGIGAANNSWPKSIDKMVKEEVDQDPLSLNLSFVGLRPPTSSWAAGESSKNNSSSNDDEEGDNNNNNNINNINGSRKKLRLSKQQSFVLEENFKEHTTLNTAQKNNLATMLNLKPRQVEVWFQNRRARTKLKLTETDCERWKKSCEELSEENKRLKKEIGELQALKKIKERASLLFAPARNGTGPAAADFVCPCCCWTTESDRAGNDRGAGKAASSCVAVDDHDHHHHHVVLKPKHKQSGLKMHG